MPELSRSCTKLAPSPRIVID